MSIREDTQTMDVLKYMRRHKKSGITSKTAFELFGITRLSAVIFRLRYIWGYDIETVMMTVKNHKGKEVDVAKYVLKEERSDDLSIRHF